VGSVEVSAKVVLIPYKRLPAHSPFQGLDRLNQDVPANTQYLTLYFFNPLYLILIASVLLEMADRGICTLLCLRKELSDTTRFKAAMAVLSIRKSPSTRSKDAVLDGLKCNGWDVEYEFVSLVWRLRRRIRHAANSAEEFL
jgi:hypothetical protein